MVIQERHTISVLGLLLLNKFLSELIFHRKFGAPEIQEHHTGMDKQYPFGDFCCSKIQDVNRNRQNPATFIKVFKNFTCSGNPTRFFNMEPDGAEEISCKFDKIFLTKWRNILDGN